MRNHHKQPAIDLTEGLPALLPAYDLILYRNKKRIAEYFAGILKADLVLALVGEVLGLIPFEEDAWDIQIATTFL